MKIYPQKPSVSGIVYGGNISRFTGGWEPWQVWRCLCKSTRLNLCCQRQAGESQVHAGHSHSGMSPNETCQVNSTHATTRQPKAGTLSLKKQAGRGLLCTGHLYTIYSMCIISIYFRYVSNVLLHKLQVALDIHIYTVQHVPETYEKILWRILQYFLKAMCTSACTVLSCLWEC